MSYRIGGAEENLDEFWRKESLNSFYFGHCDARTDRSAYVNQPPRTRPVVTIVCTATTRPSRFRDRQTRTAVCSDGRTHGRDSLQMISNRRAGGCLPSDPDINLRDSVESRRWRDFRSGPGSSAGSMQTCLELTARPASERPGPVRPGLLSNRSCSRRWGRPR